MKMILYVASIATWLAAMPTVGLIPAMILGAIVAGIGSLFISRNEIREIQSRVNQQQNAKSSILHQHAHLSNILGKNKTEPLTKTDDILAQSGTEAISTGSEVIEKDHQKTVTLLLKAANQGRASAQYHLGTLYMQGKGVEQDDVKAAEWMCKAAAQGHAAAQGILGTLYSHGHGVPQDYIQAAEWLHKAAVQGIDHAQFSLGILYLHGQGVLKDNAQASEWFRKSADQGFSHAQSIQGVINDQGLAVPKNYKQAGEQFRKAADQGAADAQFNLGTLYMYGQGMLQDYEQAAMWFRKAADQGVADAQNYLGSLYKNGRGVPQDYEQAVMWFRKAAEQGVADAQNNLGILYRENQGVPQDYEQAAMWFRKAAKKGHAIAECNLGLLYSSGQGVPQDFIEACKWFQLACGGGFSGALKYRDLVEKRLTPDQISEAKRRASSWMIELLKDTGAQVVEEVANSSNTDTATPKPKADHRTFCFADGEPLTPQMYGINAIELSLEGSENAIKEIIGSNESKVQQAISANHGPVQLHLMALQASVYYVCANMLSSCNREILTEVAEGISDGFTAVMGKYHVDNLYEIFTDYGRSLAVELKNADYDNFMDMGSTASLVVQNIGRQCNLDKILTDNHTERLRIEEIVRRNGIMLLLTLLSNKVVTYNE